jgi:hypothetical protein
MRRQVTAGNLRQFMEELAAAVVSPGNSAIESVSEILWTGHSGFEGPLRGIALT